MHAQGQKYHTYFEILIKFTDSTHNKCNYGAVCDLVENAVRRDGLMICGVLCLPSVPQCLKPLARKLFTYQRVVERRLVHVLLGHVKLHAALATSDTLRINHRDVLRARFREQHVLLQRLHCVVVHLNENVYQNRKSLIIRGNRAECHSRLWGTSLWHTTHTHTHSLDKQPM